MIDVTNYQFGTTTVSFHTSEIRRGHCYCPCRRISIQNYTTTTSTCSSSSSSSRRRRISTEMGCIKLGFQSKPSDGAVEKKSTSSSSSSKMGLVRVMNMGINCFKDQAKKKVELADHGRRNEDLLSNLGLVGGSGSVVPEHLVIMVNGIIGSAEDWRYAAEQFVKKLPDKVIVHRSKCNSATLTFDGVDLMGERLAEEVLSVVRRMPGVQKISFVAHSLGGLVARYAIGRLYEPCPDGLASVHVAEILRDEHSKFSEQCRDHPHEGRIAGLVPMNFITVASPHLGSRGNKQLPILCGLPFLEKHASQTAHWIAGRTGKHLFLTDNDDGRSPLLLRMVNDCEDLKFMSALRSFKRRVAYANANYDYMVGWRTSSIRRQRELPQPHLLVKYEKYPHIVYVERGNAVDIHTEASSLVKVKTFDLEEEMIRGLTQVSWERVDVNFQKSRQRLIAHNTIQVKSYWMHSDGAGVVFHMIDNFNL